MTTFSATDARTSALLPRDVHNAPATTRPGASAGPTLPVLQSAQRAVSTFERTIASRPTERWEAFQSIAKWGSYAAGLTAGALCSIYGYGVEATIVGVCIAQVCVRGIAACGGAVIDDRLGPNRRALGTADVRGFAASRGDDFARALQAGIAQYALTRCNPRAYSGAARGALEATIKGAASLPRETRAEVRPYVDLVVAMSGAEGLVRASDITRALERIPADDRVAATAFVREALVRPGPFETFISGEWAPLYEATRPTFPAWPAVGAASLDNESTRERLDHAAAVFAEWQQKSATAAVPGPTRRERYVSKALRVVQVGGALAAGLTIGIGAGVALLFGLNDVGADIVEAVSRREQARKRHGPDVPDLEHQSGLDRNNPLERAVLVVLAQRYLAELERTYGGNVELRDQLHAIIDGAQASEADLATASAALGSPRRATS